MTRAALLILALLCASCSKPEQQRQQVNQNFSVDLLFEHDGCKVYRFYDHGGARYYTNCSGSTSYTKSCGKNCTYLDGVAGGKQ